MKVMDVTEEMAVGRAKARMRKEDKSGKVITDVKIVKARKAKTYWVMTARVYYRDDTHVDKQVRIATTERVK